MAGNVSGRQRGQTTVLVASLVIMVAAADLITKWMATRWLGATASDHDWWIFDGQIGFEYARNTGAAFGLFWGNPELLAVISVFVAVGFCWLVFTEVRSKSTAIVSSGLIVGGALGNLVERVRHGYVTDFIAVGSWPRFNLADSAISIGVAIFVFAVVFPPELQDGNQSDETPHGPKQFGRHADSE